MQREKKREREREKREREKGKEKKKETEKIFQQRQASGTQIPEPCQQYVK